MYYFILYITAQTTLANAWPSITVGLGLVVGGFTLYSVFNDKLSKKADKTELQNHEQASQAKFMEISENIKESEKRADTKYHDIKTDLSAIKKEIRDDISTMRKDIIEILKSNSHPKT